MTRNTRWLRVAYWTAAIADFIVAGRVLVPEIMGVDQYVYPMGLMSAVAFSWGVMLVVADRKPLERRWMLVPTMLVVALLGGVALHAGLSGLLPLARIVPAVVAACVVVAILAFAYWTSREKE